LIGGPGGPIKKYFLGSELENPLVAHNSRGHSAGRRPGEPKKTPRLPGSLFFRSHGGTLSRNGSFCDWGCGLAAKIQGPSASEDDHDVGFFGQEEAE
jgi:hypothetical protein